MRLVIAVSLLQVSSAFVAPQQTVVHPAKRFDLRKVPILFDQLRFTNRQDHRDIDLTVGRDNVVTQLDENAELEELLDEPRAVELERLPTALAKSQLENSETAAITHPSLSTDEAVTAILAASEEAAAAAEASLGAASAIPGNFDVVAVSEEEARVVTDATKRSRPVTRALEKDLVAAPSVGKIIKFAIPAIGVWLCSPLLSLIDTSAVGILSGTVQQAALNPAVAVTDYTALLIAFMYTGTTNLVAAAHAKDHGKESAPLTSRTFIGALQLSTFVGLGLGSVLFALAPTLLRAIIGNDSISPAVFEAAMKYVRIRALGMPAAAMIGSAQAACLGMQDIRSPLYVLAAAAIVNFFGDMLFVGSRHAMIGGAAGAAWATVFSQYAAVAFFIRWLCYKPANAQSGRTLNLSKAILELTGKPSDKNASRRKRFIAAVKSFRGVTKVVNRTNKTSRAVSAQKEKDSSKTVRGFLQGKLRKRELVKFPSKQTVEDFGPYIAPVTSTQVGRVSGYVAMSHVVSSSLGTASMAAQQVIVSIFYCLCPIADSLSLTAQSFLPSISERKPSIARTKALRNSLSNFLKAGGASGAALTAFVCAIPLLSGFFTADPAVVALVNSVVPLLVGFFAVHGFVCSAEGLILGQKDLGFLGMMYAGFFAVVPFFMLRVKRAALSSNPGSINLTSVWKVFVSYQLFRCAAWVARAGILQRQTEKLTPISKP